MKVYDVVKVLKINEDCKQEGITEGTLGRIIQGEIRDNCFYVLFRDPKDPDDYVFAPISIEDLELVEEGPATDDWILQELPKNDPRWWCKVENGYILNLKGERKNKIPYDYNS